MWFTKSAEEVVTHFTTDPEAGLTSIEAVKRLAASGKNQLSEYQKPSLLRLFFEQINSLLIYILIAAAAISFFVKEYSDGVIIILVILMNAAIGIIQESKAEKALDELRKLTGSSAIVKRDGKMIEIPSEQLVPGDIVQIESGRWIPADLRLIETVNLKIEESSLTGESIAASKDANWKAEQEVPIGDRLNMAFMSTVATYGRGVGIVVSTGMQTEVGKIAGMLRVQKREPTPLQLKLAQLGKIVGSSAVLISALIFLIGFLQSRNPLEMFLLSISLAVAAIPEGLPAIVTIVLAFGVQRMSQQRAIVRKLPAVETLGAVSVICSDKTGTLTMNKMTVTTISDTEKIYPIQADQTEDSEAQLVFKAIALCNDATLNDQEPSGDPTEIALLSAAKLHGLDKTLLEKEYPRIFEIPFDSNRKMMTTVHEHHGRYYVMAKGALESILPLSTAVLSNGNSSPLREGNRETIRNNAISMAADALRVLAIAYKEVASPPPYSKEKLESELVFLGLVGMIDPPREEVKASIAACKSAGIRTVMITGDHPHTAFAIAKELGIAQSDSEVVTGSLLDSLKEKPLLEQVRRANVFARVSPEHKVLIVNALKQTGEIVSMTGDGVNDAPSLMEADVGVAMGKSGTDVAKGAADIVLTDDNFSTIVKAVEQGRNIYQNIRKAILFLLSCNLGELITLFAAILFGWPAPLSAIQILWVNLITDSLPAISLGLDPDDPDIMKEQPRPLSSSIFANGGGSFTLLNGILIGAITLFAFCYGLFTYGKIDSILEMNLAEISGEALNHAQTMAFIALSISQLLHALNLRSRKKSIFQLGIFSNRLLLAAIAAGILIQVALVNIPLLSHVFGLSPLSWRDIGIVVSLSFLTIVLNEGWKLVNK